MQHPPRGRVVRGKVAVGLATAFFILLPAAGVAAGVYFAYESVRTTGPMHGLAAGFFVLTVYTVGSLGGLAAGVGAGWVVARGLFRWANGCGLADIRDDGPE